MLKKNCRTAKINKLNRKEFFKNFVIEEDYHRSPKQRVLHIICFVLPVLFAFIGFFISSPIWNLFSDDVTPELFKFMISFLLFLISIIIIFVKTRNTNPTMRIRVSDKESDSEDKTSN